MTACILYCIYIETNMIGGEVLKVAFLDRDGTLNKDYPDSEWCNKKEPEILAGTLNGLRYLKEKGYELIIVTNQYIIGEGFISHTHYEKFNDALISRLREENINILDTFYCPHNRKSGCNCHKPSPGLIIQALNKYPDIDLNNSIYIGDSLCDMVLASKFGLRFYGINIECRNQLSDLSQIKEFI